MPRGKEAKVMERLNAVIIADSFTDDFKPISYECPRTLMPVGGVALIDYAMELLVMNGVEKVFVVTVAHGDKIEQHLKKMWIEKTEMEVEAVNMPGCMCYADALRRLHNLNILRHDFILMSGDVISNINNLRDAWEVHCRKREIDGSILMTQLLKEQALPLVHARDQLLKDAVQQYLPEVETTGFARTLSEPSPDVPVVPEPPAPHPIRTTVGLLGEQRGTVIYDMNVMNLLSYHVWDGAVKRPRDEDDSDEEEEVRPKADLDLQLFTKHNVGSMRLRSDLVETGMAICSLALLEMFEVNGVDFKTMQDCIRSVIQEELLGNKIMLDIVPASRFLRRVRTVEQYIDISKAVLGGWTFPLVPDASFASSYHCVATQDTNVYIDRSSRLSHTCTVGHCTLLGPDVVVGERCTVYYSVLNSKVALGSNTAIRHSHIWEDVTVGKDCTIDGALVCSRVTIGDGCKIGAGCVISFGVKLAAGTVVPPGTRITRVAKQQSEDEGSDWGDEDADAEVELTDEGEVAVVGEGGVGRKYTIDASMKLDLYKLALPQDDDDDASDVSGVFCAGDDSDDEDELSGKQLTKEEHFCQEVLAILKNAVADGSDVAGTHFVVLDVIRSCNVAFDEAPKAVLEAFLTIAMEGGDKAKKCLKVFMKTMEQWKDLLRDLLRNADERTRKETLQVMFDFAKEHDLIGERVGEFVYVMYDLELIADETILRWERRLLNERAKGALSDDDARMLDACEELLDTLKESSDESSSDDDSDES